MPHVLINPSPHVIVSGSSHGLYCKGKLPHIDHTGIVLTADEQYRKIRAGTVPVSDIICFLHEPEQRQKRVIGECESAKLRSFILLYILLVGTEPGKRASLFSELFGIPSQRHGLQQFAFMTPAPDLSFDPGDQLAYGTGIADTGRTAHDQQIHAVVMFRCESSYSQRSHTVPEQGQRNTGIFLPDPLIDGQDILQQGFRPSPVHVTKIFLALHALSVTALIMDDRDISFSRQILHKRNISFFMFAHTVHQLYDTANIAFRNDLQTIYL